MLKKALRKAISVAVFGCTILGLLIVAPSASGAVCGFEGKATGSPLLGKGDDGKYEEGVYTNCNDHPVKIKVKYYYASENRCVGPGENQLTVNPNLGALVGAEEIGKC